MKEISNTEAFEYFLNRTKRKDLEYWDGEMWWLFLDDCPARLFKDFKRWRITDSEY